MNDLPPTNLRTARSEFRASRSSKFPAAQNDRQPPHSMEAEIGVLGCILLSPADCLPECIQAFKGSSEVFFDLRHRTIFESMLSLAGKGASIDLITLTQHLRDRAQLESVGGAAYLSQLPDVVASAENLSQSWSRSESGASRHNYQKRYPSSREERLWRAPISSLPHALGP